MNYKFLPIGGTDLWSHYPTASPFMNDVLMQPPAAAQAPTAPEIPVTEDGQDYMIGSPRAVGPPADDWMVGSPRAAGAPDPEDPAAQHPQRDTTAISEGEARYEAPVDLSEQRPYPRPVTDTMMDPLIH